MRLATKRSRTPQGPASGVRPAAAGRRNKRRRASRAASVKRQRSPTTSTTETVRPSRARNLSGPRPSRRNPSSRGRRARSPAHAVSGAPEPIETAVPGQVRPIPRRHRPTRPRPSPPPPVLAESVAPPPAPVPPVVAPLRAGLRLHGAAPGWRLLHIAMSSRAMPGEPTAENLVAAAQIRHGIAQSRRLPPPDATRRSGTDRRWSAAPKSTLTLLDEIGGETFGAAA